MNATSGDVLALPQTQPASVHSGELPRSVYVAVAGLACLPTGLLWDISHHSTIGRDTFWTPAHILIQVGGIVPALLFAVIAFQTTFRGIQEQRGASGSFWGLRAPLGVLIALWGDFTTEFTWPNLQHASYFYRVACTPFPLLLVLAARAAKVRAAATIAAATYMSIYIAMILVLPLFPAHPKLAPIYHP